MSDEDPIVMYPDPPANLPSSESSSDEQLEIQPGSEQDG